MTPEQEAAVLKLGKNPLLAHQALFGHRHPDVTPPFHSDIIELWHSSAESALVMVFREGGKSTIAEEAFVIAAGYQLFHNALIIGATERRACERLRAIKHEIEQNELVELLFGRLVGHVWNEAEVILSNGVRIVAVGRGQSLRGTKHLQYRPDFCFCDDIEDEEHVRSPEARDETLKWFMSVVIPALDKRARIRVTATPLDRESLPFQLKNKLKWPTRTFPIEYRDKDGMRQPTWPGRYPLDWIDKKKAEFESVGKLDEYMREYMCVAEDPRRKVFRAGMIRTVAHVRSWQPVYAMIDPARSTTATSATTGYAVWSWIGSKLVVWDGGGEFLKPNQIVDKIFQINAEYAPVMIGVEETGLNEFLMQPIRQEMVRRSVIVPIFPKNAPKGKLQFIASLQPFFNAGDIVFAKDLPELKGQLLNYPTGRIDAPNALAYALILRPGMVVYDEFGTGNVQDKIPVRDVADAYLALNAGQGFVTGVLCQFWRGIIFVLADFIYEGDPTNCVEPLIKEANLAAGKMVKIVAPSDHWSGYNHLGLRGAVGKLPAEMQRGSLPELGRIEIRDLLKKVNHNVNCLQVSWNARWTLNGFAAGYAKEVDRHGMVKEEARPGLYRVLMEGLEAFAGLLKVGISQDHGKPNWQTTPSGQKYISALPGQAGAVDAKDSFPSVGVVTDRLNAR